MRRLAIVFVALVAGTAALLPAGAAHADPDNGNTLHIVHGTVDTVFELSSAHEFHVVGMSSNVLWKSLDFVTPTGETGRIERGVRASVTICTYTGAVSGNKYPLSSGPAAG